MDGRTAGRLCQQQRLGNFPLASSPVRRLSPLPSPPVSPAHSAAVRNRGRLTAQRVPKARTGSAREGRVLGRQPNLAGLCVCVCVCVPAPWNGERQSEEGVLRAVVSRQGKAENCAFCLARRVSRHLLPLAVTRAQEGGNPARKAPGGTEIAPRTEGAFTETPACPRSVYRHGRRVRTAPCAPGRIKTRMEKLHAGDSRSCACNVSFSDRSKLQKRD